MASNLSIVLVGALAGDVTVLRRSPPTYPRIFAADFIVLPIRAGAVSHLPRILSANAGCAEMRRRRDILYQQKTPTMTA
jgi:hypothetical protein